MDGDVFRTEVGLLNIITRDMIQAVRQIDPLVALAADGIVGFQRSGIVQLHFAQKYKFPVIEAKKLLRDFLKIGPLFIRGVIANHDAVVEAVKGGLTPR